jgi:hypothetical protein
MLHKNNDGSVSEFEWRMHDAVRPQNAIRDRDIRAGEKTY